MHTLSDVEAVCFDWGDTLMSEEGPQDRAMALWPEVRATSGAAACLARLYEKVPLCIATNATVSRRPMIELALQRVGFAGYFREIFCFTELGFKKDQFEFWQAVSSKLDLPLARIALIGDSLEQDCLAPRSFGVQAVWFNEAGRRSTPAATVPWVDSLEQFASMVEVGSPEICRRAGSTKA